MARISQYGVRSCVLLSTLVFASSSCTATEDEQPIDAWQGADYHLVIEGTINGEVLDVHLTGEEAQDTMMLYCEMEWVTPPLDGNAAEPDMTMAIFERLKIYGEIEVGGERRWVSIEHQDQDLQSGGSGSVYSIAPNSEVEDPGPDEVYFEFEFTDGLDGEETFESHANSGTMELELFEGTQMADSVVFELGTGRIGAFLDVTWNANEHLLISYSAPCPVHEIDIE